jgi:hypothetical protein
VLAGIVSYGRERNVNLLLWILQVLLALLCIWGGVFQLFKLDELRKGVAAMRVLPQSIWWLLGGIGCVSGLGLLVPGTIIGFAAAAIAAQSLVISALYVKYRDRAPLPYSLVMMFMAAFICYGRWYY